MKIWAGNDKGMFGAVLAEQRELAKSNRAALAAIPRGRIQLFSAKSTFDIGGTGDMPRVGHCTLALMGTVAIDDIALTHSISDVQSEGCGPGDLFSDKVINRERSSLGNRIQTILSNIREAEVRVAGLVQHQSALVGMITELEAQR